MSKPDYIPQDVWDVAWTAHGLTEFDEVVGRMGSVAELNAAIVHDVALIARAIMAERERCASIVETMPDLTLHMWERPGGPPGNGYSKTTRSDIAAAIRANKPSKQ